MRQFAAWLLVCLLAVPSLARADHVPDQEATVVAVVDGDTLDVQLVDGEQFRVRIIGIDTPETVAPGRPVACWGPEASARTRELLQGQVVWLERDVSDLDRFGRLVRHVWLGDELVAEVLLREGHARAYAFRPDISRAELRPCSS